MVLTAAVGLVLLVGGLAAVLTAPPTTYQSAATLAIDQPRGIAEAGDAGVIEKLSRLRYKYKGLVGTQVFAQALAGATDRPEGQVAGSLFASVDPSSLLMLVGARTHQKAEARSLANDAAKHLVAYAAKEQEQAGVPPDQRFVFQVVTDAPVAHALGSAGRRWGVVAIVLGLVVLVGAGGAWQLDRRR